MRAKQLAFLALGIALPLVLALLCGCGSGSGDTQDEDGDGYTDPGDNSVLGVWKRLDASENLIPWFAEQNISALYLTVEATQMTWRFVGNESANRCLIYPVTRSTVSDFILTNDPDSCRYELSIVKDSASDVLQIEARHKDDPTLQTYMFRFVRAPYIPAEAAGDCETSNSCPRYDVQQ